MEVINKYLINHPATELADWLAMYLCECCIGTLEDNMRDWSE